MPPSPAYNLFCVLCSTVNILSHVTRHRASQVAPQTTVWLQQTLKPERSSRPRPTKPQNVSELELTENRETSSIVVEPPQLAVQGTSGIHATVQNAVLGSTVTEIVSQGLEPRKIPPIPLPKTRKPESPTLDQALGSNASTSYVDTPCTTISQNSSEKVAHNLEENFVVKLKFTFPRLPNKQNLQYRAKSSLPPFETSSHLKFRHPVSGDYFTMEARLLPLFNDYASGLAASLGYGAASELLRRTGGASSEGSVFMTEANIKRLVSKLSQMRGAALKLGQFLSIQGRSLFPITSVNETLTFTSLDTHVLPAEVDQMFRRVQDSAHYMPDWQMEKVMTSSLGPDWAKNFQSFERLPFAAASIGQVHGAVLAASASPTGRPEPVAVKVQFPNIANSIDSDLSYIKVLLTAGRLLPKGLFLDRSVQVLKDELADECDYTREGSFLTKFGSSGYLGGDPRFKVPWVWEGSTKSVLVMERVHGTSVGDADINGMSQKDRDDIAAWILELCLKELFEFRAMQTDPNWSNFLWNAQTRRVYHFPP
ncbi:hypothetical protein C0995_011620 [Termitomyces sp. Mi166|nr:hypothetical protein C0995_011620 [Termitomyces sp. Mi166\